MNTITSAAAFQLSVSSASSVGWRRSIGTHQVGCLVGPGAGVAVSVYLSLEHQVSLQESMDKQRFKCPIGMQMNIFLQQRISHTPVVHEIAGLSKQARLHCHGVTMTSETTRDSDGLRHRAIKI